jgi:hypothetical protein
MYCRRNQMLALMDSFCSISLIALDLAEVTGEESGEANDVLMDSDVDPAELEDVISEKAEKKEQPPSQAA